MRNNARRLAGVWPVGLLALVACSDRSRMLAADFDPRLNESDDSGATPCGSAVCFAGFHCSFDECVPDAPPPPPVPAAGRDPLASGRYVFSLEVENRRLVRIDSSELTVAPFAAGLAPMDLAVVGSRETTIVLDGMDLVEVLDHRADDPSAVAWPTARSLSHLVVSPTGDHVVAYYDWDDPRAQERQPEPGNINQVSILYLGGADGGLSEADARLRNITVGFLPRDVRFSATGDRAVVISRNALTPMDLGDVAAGVALAEASVSFDATAEEILIDDAAAYAVARYPDDARVDVLDLASGGTRCFLAANPVTDLTLVRDGRLAVLFGDGIAQSLSLVALSDAAEVCTPLVAQLDVGSATRVELNNANDLGLAFAPTLTTETVWRLDLTGPTATALPLEKAVAAVAFASDGQTLLIANLKKDGVPAWNPQVEDPEESIDKSYGVTWLDLTTGTHRLVVSNTPFGAFAFVPALGGDDAATYQALPDPVAPQLLRIAHRPGFDDRWIELAGRPLQMGYLPLTERVYVTEEHPWGRVTFLDPAGETLRHVTGFALEVQ